MGFKILDLINILIIKGAIFEHACYILPSFTAVSLRLMYMSKYFLSPYMSCDLQINNGDWTRNNPECCSLNLNNGTKSIGVFQLNRRIDRSNKNKIPWVECSQSVQRVLNACVGEDSNRGCVLHRVEFVYQVPKSELRQVDVPALASIVL